MPGYVGLGTAQLQRGDLVEASVALERALQLNGDCTQALDSLGAIHSALGNWEQASVCKLRLVELDSSNPSAHNDLGFALLRLGRTEEAISHFNAAIALQPDFGAAHNHLGMAFVRRQRSTDAVSSFRSAVALEPQNADYVNNLGAALKNLDDFTHAIWCCQRALDLREPFPAAVCNLGEVFLAQRKLAEARDCFERAIELEPTMAEAHVALAVLMLLRGELERGWLEYEWRWRGILPPREFSVPRWMGQGVSGKTVLLLAEQGLGDSIQFIRYVPLVKSRGATVVVQCQSPLLSLMRTGRDIDCVVGEHDKLPDIEFHASLLDLPALFHTTLDSIPANVPYLFADPQLVSQWRRELANVSGFRIGMNWRGRAGDGPWRNRNLPVALLASLASVSRTRLISLQHRGAPDLQLLARPLPIVTLGDDLDTSNGAFMDTAAIMMNLDLVITSDTAIAHLAGALGVPVWVALPFVPDWRWLLDRSDSPWYPTMRLFRKKSPGDWAGVFVEIEAALRELLAKRG